MPKNPMEIRKVTQTNLEILQEISIQTFTETFEAVNTAENLLNYIKNHFSIEQLSSEWNDPNSEFYLAYSNEEAAGYLKINIGNAQTENHDINALEVQRIYVLKKYHRQNIGQLLLDKAISDANSKKLSSIWLGVWEENHRALQFYTKNGFVVFDKHIFTLGDDPQTDLLMKLVIS